MPSQLPKLLLHDATVHVDEVHDAVALASKQRVPQAPQWLALFVMLTSQPLLATPSQLAKPSAQRSNTHPPATQRADALGNEHACEQAPQCETLVDVSTQLAPHRTAGAAQLLTHAPVRESHMGVEPEHTAPQRPQLREVDRLASQPLLAFASQSPKPLAHPRTQEPAVHVAVAFGAAMHADPQPPQ